MCECLNPACPQRRVWEAAVRAAAVEFFTVLGGALRIRALAHPSDDEADCFNPHLNEFYRQIDSAQAALGRKPVPTQDVVGHLLQAAFRRVRRKHWKQLRDCCRLARSLMTKARAHREVLSEIELAALMTEVRSCEGLVLGNWASAKLHDSRLTAHPAIGNPHHQPRRRHA